jgi:hypothetical protein
MEASSLPSLEMSAASTAGINVRAAGAKGDGVTSDSAVLQRLIYDNPAATLYFPAGTYRLHNHGLNTPGLSFTGFSGTVRMASGARFSCDTANRDAGQCIFVSHSSGATFYNLSITYAAIGSLPMARDASTSNALLVEDAHDITFSDTTILGSSGSGAWNTNSTNITYSGSTHITRTTADGLHFENVADASVASLYTNQTGDDAIGDTNIAPSHPNCGLIVSSAQIHNSHSRGIAVAGGCNAIFNNIQITGTTNSALAVIQDTSINSRISTNVKFSNAVISGVGTIPGVAGNKYCLDIGNSTYVTANNISCADSAETGVFVYNNAAHILAQNIDLKSAGNNGFQSVGSTYVSFINDTVTGATGNGFDVEGSTHVVLQSCGSNGVAGYGFYHSGSSTITESALLAQNVARSRGNNRAWWAENMSGSLSVNGLSVTDDQSSATGYVVGDAMDSSVPVTVTNIIFNLRNGSPSIQPSAHTSKYYMAGQNTPIS